MADSVSPSSGMSFGSVLSALSSGVGLLGSIGNLFSSDQDDSKAYYQQRSLMEYNNKFQSEENQKSRDYTSAMYDKQWSDLTSWNDYKNVVKRAIGAGVSPSAIFQSGAPAQLGGISPASVGHTASPSPGYGDIVNPVNRQAESFHSVASGLQALSQAAKSGIETTKIGSLMQSEMEANLVRAGLERVQQDAQAFELSLRQVFGEKLYQSQLGTQFAQAINAFAQASLFAQQGLTEESKRELNKAHASLAKAQESMSREQANLYNVTAEWYPKYMTASVNEMNASATEHVAAAREKRASAAQTEFFNELRSSPQVRSSLADQLIELGSIAQNQNKLTQKQADLVKWQAEQLKKATDNYEILMWSNIINQTIGTAANAIGEFTKFGLAKKFLNGSTAPSSEPPMEYWPGATTRGDSW